MKTRLRFYRVVKNKKYFVYVFFILVGVLSTVRDLTYKNYLSIFKELTNNTVLPIKAHTYRFVNFFKRSNSSSVLNAQLLFENKQLKAKIHQLQQQMIQLTKFQITNDSVILPVLGFEQLVFNSHLLIDIGTGNNIKIGDVASTFDGLVGLVTHISGRVACITTISDKRISVPVKSQANQHLILKGTNKCLLRSVAVQHQLNPMYDIKVGDILYTSGEGGIFRPNVPVAKVVSIGREIEAVPILNPGNLEFVQIIPQINSVLTEK